MTQLGTGTYEGKSVEEVTTASATAARISLTPRAFRNGDDISHMGFADTVMVPKYESVFREIDSLVGVRGAGAPVAQSR
ncbi:MAG: hypothetical protein WKG00_06955 [Polyangiaceae bacterium]